MRSPLASGRAELPRVLAALSGELRKKAQFDFDDAERKVRDRIGDRVFSRDDGIKQFTGDGAETKNVAQT